MYFSLNQEQARSLANFFFDVAKGAVLGSIGFAAIAQIEIKFLTIVSSIIFSFVCIRFALLLLEKVE